MARKKGYFEAVDPRVDFVELEKKLLSWWYESGVVDSYFKKNKKAKRTFSFLDGPITANNPMGVHHAWGRTYKDLWQRYKNMQGLRQRFQNGFDAQGLWVEVEVEKELGFKSKKDIEKYGVTRFVQKCKDRVMKYSKMQTEQSKRLGYFMDWDNSYYTMSDENNYMIWHFLKVCHKNGWLYKGNDSVPWCPRCETAISQHEILTEDYKEVAHESVYFSLPILGEDEYLLVWTTTPWTIPANIAVAVDEKLNYSLVRTEDGHRYWVAKEAAPKIFPKGKYRIVKTVKGAKLVGKRYEGPFDELPAVQKVSGKKGFHRVVATDPRILSISTDEGTGLVHTAVSAGSEDFKLGKKLGLPMIPVIADDARYLPGLGFLSGENAKTHPEIVLDYMREQDKRDDKHWVYKIEDYIHRYPACWRCKTELVWKVTEEWYIAMDKGRPTLRERMKKVARKIRWIPAFGLDRELDWLNNMQDWLISKKNRYWGLALPIWECAQCGHFEVIGSKEELKKRATTGWKQFEGKSPHKPQIDKVKIKCTKCGSQASRIEPVGNPWLDAGIVPYSTITEDNKGAPLYLANQRKWREWFPADFITESFPGQFKNWFYSLIAQSTVLENEEPFRTVLGFATLLGEDGRPMHKSWGNMIEFNEGADKIGVDVMRWMYVKQDPAQNLLFGYNLADQTRRSFHLMLWNVYNFFVTYANLDSWQPGGAIETRNILDIWIVARLSETINIATSGLEEYDAREASQAIEDFTGDLSLWYVRRSRDRVGPNVPGSEDKEACYYILYSSLVTLTQILAPFLPFLSEEIYKNLTKEESVHLSEWPTAPQLSKEEKDLIKDMQLVRKVVERGHAVRKEAAIPVRQPLRKIAVVHSNKLSASSLLQLIKEELNIKEIEWKARKGVKEPEVDLDTKLTPKLAEEGKTRELARKIQEERRKAGTPLDARIEVVAPWLPRDKGLLDWLKQRTLTESIKQGNKLRIKELQYGK